MNGSPVETGASSAYTVVFKLTNKKRTGEKVLQEVKEAELLVEFHDGVEILFSLRVIHQVAKLAKAKRRRGRKSLSPEGKQKWLGRGRPTVFLKKVRRKKDKNRLNFRLFWIAGVQINAMRPDRQLGRKSF